MAKETAFFGMGCFWSPQDLFDKTSGVLKTEVGYMGSHTEVVKVEFDIKKISYEELLDIFWENHNPMTKYRQGLNIGKQYRPVVFYTSKRQKKLAQKAKEVIQRRHRFRKVATSVEEAGEFEIADEHHQKYLAKNRGAVC